ncbi:Imm8 family immunity protein [Treponema zioleckii]|uniref:Imm8 family immunity protein n=1 Tax=Treponema zioleckii TaxID=331680 RepID=UPI00168AF956|nr:Imm8 family immunity protein [Treponema zioleckii]
MNGNLLDTNVIVRILNGDRDLIEQCITDIVSKIEGKDWFECVDKLRQLGQYEFDDYQT